MPTGKLWAWGYNNSYELGNGNTTTQSSPVSVLSTKKFVAVDSGTTSYGGYTLAVANDGTIWSWGDNFYGCLGIGQSGQGPFSSPEILARPGSYNAVATGGAGARSYAIDGATGQVYCWGKNDDNFLGTGTTTSSFNSPESLARIASYSRVTGGYFGGFSIDAGTGAIWGWGSASNGFNGTSDGTDYSTPVTVARTGSYSDVKSYSTHTLAIDASTGMVYSWGFNDRGQLGTNDTTTQSSPVAIDALSSYSAIAVGDKHSLAINAANGNIYSWGYNEYGQLGIANTTDHSHPQSVQGMRSYVAIAAANNTSYALDSDGNVWAWGNGNVGQLGSGTTIATTPTQIAKVDRDAFAIGRGVNSGFATFDVGAISFFSAASVADGTNVTSTINSDKLIEVIQTQATDTYFDSTSEIGSVFVKYTHQDGRQRKTLVHTGPGLTFQASWSDGARDGTWQKTQVVAYDHDGAMVTLTRATIGATEDLTHSDGTTILNT